MSTVAGFAPHPIANLFPMISEQDLDALAADIRENGLLEPIVLHEGMILDGRNRYAACEQADAPIRVVEWNGEGGSPLRFVLSHNLHRRHLTTSQRAAIAAEVLPMFQEEAKKRQAHGQTAPGRGAGNASGQKSQSVSLYGTAVRARDEAAALMNVSSASVERAKRVKEIAPDEFEKVKTGEVTVTAAHRAAGLGDINDRRKPDTPTPPISRRPMERQIADLTRALAAIHGTCTALANVDVPADLPDEIKQRAIGELREAAAAVNRFRRQIKES